MVAIVALALALTAVDSPAHHVRASDDRVLSIIESGLAGSVTFRRVVASLNDSDVIVYIDPKLTRDALGGFLSHNVVSAGGVRYLRIAVEIQGSRRRVASLLAHEIQHAVEVAQAPGARDAASLERLFRQRAVAYGCGGTTCYETQAAIDVQRLVNEELGGHR